MDKFELYALNHYLSDWPESLTFNGIINALIEDDQDYDITVFETYEVYPCEDVAHFIIEMVDNLEKAFG